MAWPSGLSVSAQGVFIADWLNNRVRLLVPNGTILPFAGSGTSAYAGDGGPANDASLASPNAAVFDVNGNLLIAGDHLSIIVTAFQHKATYSSVQTLEITFYALCV
jgi:hypothetical protein